MKMLSKLPMVCAVLLAATNVFAQTEAADTTIMNGKIADEQTISSDSNSQSNPDWEEFIINRNGVHYIKGHRNSDGTTSFLPSADIFQAAMIVLSVVIAGLAVWLTRAGSQPEVGENNKNQPTRH